MDIEMQEKLFFKYWNSGIANKSAKDMQTADNIRRKMLPVIEEIMDENDREQIAQIYETFSDFLFDYIRIAGKTYDDESQKKAEMKQLAEKAIEYSPNSFYGHYFLVVHAILNLKNMHQGTYDAQGLGDLIVGGAINLLVKGVTASAAGISDVNLNKKIENLLAVYKEFLKDSPVDANVYLDYTSKFFKIAEFCIEDRKLNWQEIYKVISDFDSSNIDYSVVEKELVEETKEKILEIVILADAKL